MTLGYDHVMLLGRGQQLNEMLSRSNLTVRSFGSDSDLMYVCTVKLILEM